MNSTVIKVILILMQLGSNQYSNTQKNTNKSTKQIELRIGRLIADLIMYVIIMYTGWAMRKQPSGTRHQQDRPQLSQSSSSPYDTHQVRETSEESVSQDVEEILKAIICKQFNKERRTGEAKDTSTAQCKEIRTLEQKTCLQNSFSWRKETKEAQHLGQKYPKMHEITTEKEHHFKKETGKHKGQYKQCQEGELEKFWASLRHRFEAHRTESIYTSITGATDTGPSTYNTNERKVQKEILVFITSKNEESHDKKDIRIRRKKEEVSSTNSVIDQSTNKSTIFLPIYYLFINHIYLT